jgi:hypothetical protein
VPWGVNDGLDIQKADAWTSCEADVVQPWAVARGRARA